MNAKGLLELVAQRAEDSSLNTDISLFTLALIFRFICKKNIVKVKSSSAHRPSKILKRVKKVIANQTEHIRDMLASLAEIARMKSKLDRRFDVILSLFTYCWLSVVVQLVAAASQTQIPNPKLHKEMTFFLRSFFRAEATRKKKLDRR